MNTVPKEKGQNNESFSCVHRSAVAIRLVRRAGNVYRAKFSVTLPDFLPKLYPGVNTYIFHPDQLDSCGRPGQQCAFAGFTFYQTEDGTMTVTYAELISPTQNVYDPSSAFLNLTCFSTARMNAPAVAV